MTLKQLWRDVCIWSSMSLKKLWRCTVQVAAACLRRCKHVPSTNPLDLELTVLGIE